MEQTAKRSCEITLIGDSQGGEQVHTCHRAEGIAGEQWGAGFSQTYMALV